MSNQRHVLVYGTLRLGAATIAVAGFKMYSLGGFPGIVPGESTDVIYAERHPIINSDHEASLDMLEGWVPECPERSLYLKEEVNGDVIYVFNHEVKEDHRIESGDWLKHTGHHKGSNCSLMERYGLVAAEPPKQEAEACT